MDANGFQQFIVHKYIKGGKTVKKFLILLLTAIVLVSAFSLSFFAARGEEYLQWQKEVNAEDIDEIKETVKNEYGNWDAYLAPREILLKGREEALETIDYDELIKVHFFKDEDLVKGYKESGSFNDLIADEYMWRLTIYSTLSEVNMMKGNDGKWSIREGNDGPEVLKRNFPDVDYSIKGIMSNVEKSRPDFDFESVRYVNHTSFVTDFLYFTEKGVEYVIPYRLGYLTLGLENGKVYKASELMSIIEENDNVFDGSRDPNLVYGGGVGATTENNNILYYILGASALVIVTGVSAFIIVRRKKAKKLQSTEV